MSNKTISINPSLFSISGYKTKKNREKKPKPTTFPLISPSVLKNKLLKRIKEHKQKETQNLENNKRNLENNKRNLSKKEDIPIKSNNEILNYTDEFTDSINYLQTLSKQKHNDEEKKKSDFLKQKQREELERKTIRNYHSIGGQTQEPIINIDLPEELIQPIIPISTETFHIKPKDDVPYGILKGGTKPSYREWSRTQRSNIVTNPKASLIIQGGNLPSEKSARENRLNILKQKIKNKTEETTKDPLITQNLIKKPNTESNIQLNVALLQPNVVGLQPILTTPTPQENLNQEQMGLTGGEVGGKVIATKHITKKTIKRKYTLGKSRIKKTVGVLIKDRGTRKQVLSAQKDLKRRNINDIKIYLREHNLIKTGSNAPNDVLRKLYESAMLSGEITNSNVDILLHNFSKEDKEL